MELTKQILENHRACSEGMEWYISNDEPASVEETIEKLLASDEHEKFGWSNWLLSRVLPLDDKIRYAIFAAELVIDIFEKEFPEDKRPRNAIESAREYLSNKDVAAADEACAAAYAAAYAAARNAAYDAARAAANAVRAAADAACAAAEATYTTYVHYADYAARVAADAASRAADYAARAVDYAADAAADAAACADDAAGEAYAAAYTKIINYGLSLLKKNWKLRLMRRVRLMW